MDVQVTFLFFELHVPHVSTVRFHRVGRRRRPSVEPGATSEVETWVSRHARGPASPGVEFFGNDQK
jgi:hypothetical protein